ncbi:hypothetical protein CYMTET_27475 [Cymbomonas tetramitiformis]|uniref:Uncharacterized protein n=1 Tax=Cymbomonas tetramitiformis TaxID=36881 RepID=A0AAE0FPT0_9CHLO|nr:hypothetical protein CYMTET_27475 [Cymbomonas tetramitiformis]
MSTTGQGTRSQQYLRIMRNILNKDLRGDDKPSAELQVMMKDSMFGCGGLLAEGTSSETPRADTKYSPPEEPQAEESKMTSEQLVKYINAQMARAKEDEDDVPDMDTRFAALSVSRLFVNRFAKRKVRVYDPVLGEYEKEVSLQEVLDEIMESNTSPWTALAHAAQHWARGHAAVLKDLSHGEFADIMRQLDEMEMDEDSDDDQECSAASAKKKKKGKRRFRSGHSKLKSSLEQLAVHEVRQKARTARKEASSGRTQLQGLQIKALKLREESQQSASGSATARRAQLEAEQIEKTMKELEKLCKEADRRAALAAVEALSMERDAMAGIMAGVAPAGEYIGGLGPSQRVARNAADPSRQMVTGFVEHEAYMRGLGADGADGAGHMVRPAGGRMNFGASGSEADGEAYSQDAYDPASGHQDRSGGGKMRFGVGVSEADGDTYSQDPYDPASRRQDRLAGGQMLFRVGGSEADGDAYSQDPYDPGGSSATNDTAGRWRSGSHGQHQTPERAVYVSEGPSAKATVGVRCAAPSRRPDVLPHAKRDPEEEDEPVPPVAARSKPVMPEPRWGSGNPPPCRSTIDVPSAQVLEEDPCSTRSTDSFLGPAWDPGTMYQPGHEATSHKVPLHELLGEKQHARQRWDPSTVVHGPHADMWHPERDQGAASDRGGGPRWNPSTVCQKVHSTAWVETGSQQDAQANEREVGRALGPDIKRPRQRSRSYDDLNRLHDESCKAPPKKLTPITDHISQNIERLKELHQAGQGGRRGVSAPSEATQRIILSPLQKEPPGPVNVATLTLNFGSEPVRTHYTTGLRFTERRGGAKPRQRLSEYGHRELPQVTQPRRSTFDGQDGPWPPDITKLRKANLLPPSSHDPTPPNTGFMGAPLGAKVGSRGRRLRLRSRSHEDLCAGALLDPDHDPEPKLQ